MSADIAREAKAKQLINAAVSLLEDAGFHIDIATSADHNTRILIGMRHSDLDALILTDAEFEAKHPLVS